MFAPELVGHSNPLSPGSLPHLTIGTLCDYIIIIVHKSDYTSCVMGTMAIKKNGER